MPSGQCLSAYSPIFSPQAKVLSPKSNTQGFGGAFGPSVLTVRPPSSTTPMVGNLCRIASCAVTGPVSGEPAIAMAPAAMSFSYNCPETVADASSLCGSSLNWRPSTPPEALILSTAICAPLTVATPVDPYAPVVPAMRPMRYGSPAARAAVCAADNAVAAASVVQMMAFMSLVPPLQRERYVGRVILMRPPPPSVSPTVPCADQGCCQSNGNWKTSASE